MATRSRTTRAASAIKETERTFTPAVKATIQRSALKRKQDMGVSETDINSVVNIFATSMPQMNVCEVFTDQNFANFVIKGKTSMSDSEVMFGTLIRNSKIGSNVDVALKIWLDWDEIQPSQLKAYESQLKKTLPKEFADYIDQRLNFVEFLKGLNYEVLMYKFVTTNIIQENLSPNFIPILAFGKCPLESIMDSVIDTLPAGKSKQLKDFFKPLEVFPDLSLNIMITGTNRSNITSFTDVMDKDKLSSFLGESERASIIFQCMYSLCLLEYFQISHNDLHLGNLLMEVLDSPVCLTFTFENNEVSFRTRYIPKFYDWDRGYQESLGENPVLNTEFHYTTNAINNFVPNRDYYQFICELNKYPFFWKLISPILMNPEYNSWNYKGAVDIIPDYKVSGATVTKLKDYVKIHKKTKNISDTSGGYYITMKQSDVLDTFTKPEIFDLFSYTDADGNKTLEKFAHSDSLYFSTNKPLTEVTKFEGFNCQSLHLPGDNLLVNLPLIFSDVDFFDAITSNLEKCEKELENNFVFPS